jgi:hypothetical protein
MAFSSDTLANVRVLDGTQWGGINASELEKRLPRSAANLTTIRWRSSTEAVLTDDLLRVAARSAGSALKVLSLQDCGRLSDCGLLAVAEHCSAGLRTLELRGCVGLTDACLNLLSERCSSSLSSVDLSGSPLITDAAVGLLIARCPGMTSISLANCDGITDATVALIAAAAGSSSGRGSLGRLDLSGCMHVTGESCDVLVASGALSTSLWSVEMRGTGASVEEQRLLTDALQRHQGF